MPVIFEYGNPTQADLCEFDASLDYIASTRSAKATETLHS